MKGFDPASSFGENVAARYDDHLRGDEEAAASFLSALAQGRPALEFAIGTGRIAIPLAEKGVQVDGIELSPHMVDRLRAKIGNNPINVTIGDMSTTTINRRYSLVDRWDLHPDVPGRPGDPGCGVQRRAGGFCSRPLRQAA